MKAIRLALLALSCVAIPAAAASQECLRFEPAEVELRGALVEREFPGPPNYESVEGGDRAERAYILELTEPICVRGDPESELDTEGHAGIREVQVWSPDAGLAARVDGRVRLRGRLSPAITGHHRTPVVLRVTHIGAAEE